MSDIVESLRELDKSKHIGYRVGWQRKAGADCNAAADEIERLRLDAARYRWLKTRKASDWEFFGWQTDTDAAIDAAIDAARKGTAPTRIPPSLSPRS